jgi:nitroreductase
MNPVMQSMLKHASVRSFQDKAIDATLLEQILSCGQAASSSGFKQAYSVVRVTNPQSRKLIATAAGNQQWVLDAPEFLVFCADMQRIQYACHKMGQGDLEGYTEHFITATVDVALMAQNVLLAAESNGLGGVFIGGIRNNPQAVCDCLELPDLVYPVFGMCLGWPAQQMEHKPRFPLPAILHLDTYQASNISQQVDEYDSQMQAYYTERSANIKNSNWSEQIAQATQGKQREHMLPFLQGRGFLKR